MSTTTFQKGSIFMITGIAYPCYRSFTSVEFNSQQLSRHMYSSKQLTTYNQRTLYETVCGFPGHHSICSYRFRFPVALLLLVVLLPAERLLFCPLIL
jgi:hypothetical protein